MVVVHTQLLNITDNPGRLTLATLDQQSHSFTLTTVSHYKLILAYQTAALAATTSASTAAMLTFTRVYKRKNATHNNKF